MVFRSKENLSVQSTKSYCTDSRIRLGTGAYRRCVTFPFPASPHFSQEGTNQLRVLLGVTIPQVLFCGGEGEGGMRRMCRDPKCKDSNARVGDSNASVEISTPGAEISTCGRSLESCSSSNDQCAGRRSQQVGGPMGVVDFD